MLNVEPQMTWYNELKRPDIISKIKDIQYNFFQRLVRLNETDALVKSIMNLCYNTSIMEYYISLNANNRSLNMRDREMKIFNSNSSMLQYYSSIVNVIEKCSIYNNFIDDRKRTVITRWRLSNHKLFIETGRYSNPPIPRNDRICVMCNILEDEFHAIFKCPFI